MNDVERDSAPPSSSRSRRRDSWTSPEPAPGAPPGTLMVEHGDKPKMFLIDYDEHRLVEKEIQSIDECIQYLTDDTPSITWIDVRGLCDRRTLERMGEIFKIHPLALEDLVNTPQRPKSDVYPAQQVIISRMVQLGADGTVKTEQLGILFAKDYVLTVQEDPDRDCLEIVRDHLRKHKGPLRDHHGDRLAYALLDAVIDGFYPVLEQLGERLEDLELEVASAPHGASRRIHDIKRELLTIRRAIWPQRDLLNGLLRDESPIISKETRVYLRDTYDHAVQVMDMVETFREIASGLMDLYLSGVSNRMNEIMKVLTIISTIFLPLTFIAGVYGMNFEHMPELKWPHGYAFALGLMGASVIVLLTYYRKKGWLGGSSDDDPPDPPKQG
jgi:magnesium transporter